MTKQQLWDEFLKQAPDAKDGDHVVKLRARGLRRLLDQAWNEGHEAGIVKGRVTSDRDDVFSQMFGGAFGKR